MFSARDLVRQIPAEWQENIKHRRTKEYATFLENLRRPAAQHGGGPVVLGRAGGAGRARPLGGVDPPRPGAPGHRAPARVEHDVAVGAVRQHLRDRPGGVRADLPGQRVAGRARVGDDPPAQRAAQRRTPEPPLPALRPRAPGAQEPLGSSRVTAAVPARGRAPVGQRPRPVLGQRARTAWVRRRRRPRRPRPDRSPALRRPGQL